MLTNEPSKRQRIEELLLSGADLTRHEIAEAVDSTESYVNKTASHMRRRGGVIPKRGSGVGRAAAPAGEVTEVPAVPEVPSGLRFVQIKRSEAADRGTEPPEPPAPPANEWRCAGCQTEGRGSPRFCPGCGGEFA